MQDPFLTCRDPTPVLRHDELASTNSEAERLIAVGEQGPIWVTAKHQTAGRGRNGRVWQPARGNLFASLIVNLWCEPNEIGQLSILAGSALAETVAALPLQSVSLPATPCLKWPNDLLLPTGKAGGILVETTRNPSGALSCIIGIGVNIEATPSVDDRPAACLRDAGYAPITPEALLERLDQKIREGFAQLAGPNGFAAIKTQWLKHALPIGAGVSVKASNRIIEGQFAGLADDGALLLKQDGRQLTITHGDVSDPPLML